MGIQKCEKCGTIFNYIDVIDSVGWGYRHLNCRNCGVKYNLKIRYIFIIILLLVLPIFLINRMQSMASTMLIKILLLFIYISYVSAIVALCPFFVRHDLEEEKQLN